LASRDCESCLEALGKRSVADCVFPGCSFFTRQKNGGRSESAAVNAIASGAAEPAPRSRKRNERVNEAEAELQEEPEDEVVLHDDEGQRYVFVDGDDEGDLATPDKTVTPDPVKQRARKVFKKGTDPKNRDVEVEDPYGRVYQAADGVVKINLAKLIMRPVTVEEIEAKRFRDGRGNLIDDKCWRCHFTRSEGKDVHHEFSHIGSNTGNLMQHCEQHHEQTLEALARLIEEKPKDEAKFACEEYIQKMQPPDGAASLARFLGKGSKETSNELLVLAWFLDANIGFNQFDNELFKQLIRDLNGRSFPSSTTMVERVLPVLYRYATEYMKDCLRKCRSFYTSFDGWSKNSERFISQSYHCIDPASFRYNVLALDFIHCNTSHYMEVLAGVLHERQEHWTAGMDPEPILTGGIADGASDVQSAGRHLLGNGSDDEGEKDMSRCQNHKMKSAYEALERGAPQFKVAIDALAELFTSVSHSANVNAMLKAFQFVNEVSSAALSVYSETRWEGRVALLECALKLRKSLPCLKEYAVAQKIGAACSDFLDEPFFERLVVYHKHLKVVHNVSRLFQSHCFPAGHLVLLAYYELARMFAPSTDLDAEAHFETAFRDAVLRSIRDCLVSPLTSSANAFAKAAIFHPDICRLVQHGVLSEDVFKACVESVENDIDALAGEDNDKAEITKIVFRRYLKKCKDRAPVPFLGFDALKLNGVYGQTDALTYWRNIGKEMGSTFGALIPIASMLLALPAGESHNEFVFSCSGRILTRDRSSMSPMRLEQLTIIVMFIRNFGWSQTELMDWLKRAMVEVQSQQQRK
jgi:hypothetical protein